VSGADADSANTGETKAVGEDTVREDEVPGTSLSEALEGVESYIATLEAKGMTVALVTDGTWHLAVQLRSECARKGINLNPYEPRLCAHVQPPPMFGSLVQLGF
jgi:hypothetical protein